MSVINNGSDLVLRTDTSYNVRIIAGNDFYPNTAQGFGKKIYLDYSDGVYIGTFENIIADDDAMIVISASDNLNTNYITADDGNKR